MTRTSNSLWSPSRRVFLKAATGVGTLSLAGCLTDANGSANVHAYVTDTYDGSVTVIDSHTLAVVETIDVGEATTHGIAVDSEERYVYVGDEPTGQVVVIDTDGYEVVETIDLGKYVHGLDVSPDGEDLYVSTDDSQDADEGSGELIVIDANTFSVRDRIPTEGSGHTIFDPDGLYAYVTMYHYGPGHQDMNRIGVIERASRNFVQTVSVNEGTINEIGVDPAGDILYLGSRTGEYVSAVSTDTWEEVRRIDTGTGTHGITVPPDGHHVWTANRGTSDIRVFETESGDLVETIVGGDNHITVSPDGSQIYATSIQDEVIVVDADSYEILERIAVGGLPHEITFPAGARRYE